MDTKYGGFSPYRVERGVDEKYGLYTNGTGVTNTEDWGDNFTNSARTAGMSVRDRRLEGFSVGDSSRYKGLVGRTDDGFEDLLDDPIDTWERPTEPLGGWERRKGREKGGGGGRSGEGYGVGLAGFGDDGDVGDDDFDFGIPSDGLWRSSGDRRDGRLRRRRDGRAGFSDEPKAVQERDRRTGKSGAKEKTDEPLLPQEGLRSAGKGLGRKSRTVGASRSDANLPDVVLANVGSFRAWFSGVCRWQMAAVVVWHSLLVGCIVGASLLHIQGFWAGVCALFGAVISLSPDAFLDAFTSHFLLSRKRIMLIGWFTASQLLVAFCHVFHFRLKKKAVSLLDKLFSWIISYRTLMFVPGILAAGTTGGSAYLTLADSIHGDHSRRTSSLHRDSHEVVWSSVVVLSTVYAFHVVFRQPKVARFPSLQRRRLLQMKGVLPRCLSQAALISLLFAISWILTCKLAGPQAVVRLVNSCSRSVLETVFGLLPFSVNIDAVLPLPQPNPADWQPNALTPWTAYTVFILSFLLLSSWELARMVVWVIKTGRLRMKIDDLLVAISDDSNPYAQHLGFLYLVTIADHLRDYRKKIYSGQSRKGAPWRVVSKAIITVLETAAADVRDLQHPIPYPPPGRRTPFYYIKWVLVVSHKDVAEAVSQGVQLCVWAAEAAAFLAVKALREDSHGEVNRTLPNVVNAMLALSISLRDYIQSKDPYVFIGSQKKMIKLHGHQLARSQWLYLASRLDTAIYRIAAGYYEHLKNFEFPPENAALLERYLNF
ncbi:hypothetical protein AAMO2058_001500300 [Amorphochlora amoebiformis]